MLCKTTRWQPTRKKWPKRLHICRMLPSHSTSVQPCWPCSLVGLRFQLSGCKPRACPICSRRRAMDVETCASHEPQTWGRALRDPLAPAPGRSLLRCELPRQDEKPPHLLHWRSCVARSRRTSYELTPTDAPPVAPRSGLPLEQLALQPATGSSQILQDNMISLTRPPSHQPNLQHCPSQNRPWQLTQTTRNLTESATARHVVCDDKATCMQRLLQWIVPAVLTGSEGLPNASQTSTFTEEGPEALTTCV